MCQDDREQKWTESQNLGHSHPLECTSSLVIIYYKNNIHS
jgi:hypothetical protein